MQLVASPEFRMASASLFSNLVLVWTATAVYLTHPYFLRFYSDDARFLLLGLAVVYSVLSPAFFLGFLQSRAPSHGLNVFRGFRRVLQARGLCWSPEERLSTLLTGVRAFFIPLMANAVIGHAHQIGYRLSLLDADTSIDRGLDTYYVVLAMMFMIDTLVFLLGYMVESPGLSNHVRSVDSSASGWFATLSCYSPFSGVTMLIIPWAPTYELFIESGDFRDIIMAVVVFFTALTLVAVAALGLKASNLTHRGVVTNGPYAVVRHPIYSLKLLTWIAVALPSLNVSSTLGIAVWALIYLARAITEERHLSQDPAYVAYQEHVKYRFIPGLI
jgi:protein-S-isoprenylcysteine O-methyltransferase Ste14